MEGASLKEDKGSTNFIRVIPGSTFRVGIRRLEHKDARTYAAPAGTEWVQVKQYSHVLYTLLSRLSWDDTGHRREVLIAIS